MLHRLARLPLAACLVAVAAAAPLGAQGSSWQGVVTFHVASDNNGSDMTYYQGSGIARMDISQNEEHAIIVLDQAHSTSTMIMPAQKMYMTSSMKSLTAATQKQMSKTKLTKTGNTEVIAGHKCTYFHAADTESGEQSDICVATDMGTFIMLQRPTGNGSASLWERLFSAKGGFFPLKIISHRDGKSKVEMVATKIEAKSLDPSLFVPPASYKKMDMGAMMQGTH